jgi:hypothetical protein
MNKKKKKEVLGQKTAFSSTLQILLRLREVSEDYHSDQRRFPELPSHALSRWGFPPFLATSVFLRKCA